eukprot:scaffold2353_cov167-Amphora_coffeaeformis.AAC.4
MILMYWANPACTLQYSSYTQRLTAGSSRSGRDGATPDEKRPSRVSKKTTCARVRDDQRNPSLLSPRGDDTTTVASIIYRTTKNTREEPWM